MTESILAQVVEKTQHEKVLERLKNGEHLSVRKIQQKLWINSPTKVISDLRAKGYKIDDYYIKTGKTRYKVYYMEELA